MSSEDVAGEDVPLQLGKPLGVGTDEWAYIMKGQGIRQGGELSLRIPGRHPDWVKDVEFRVGLSEDLEVLRDFLQPAAAEELIRIGYLLRGAWWQR